MVMPQVAQCRSELRGGAARCLLPLLTTSLRSEYTGHSFPRRVVGLQSAVYLLTYRYIDVQTSIDQLTVGFESPDWFVRSDIGCPVRFGYPVSCDSQFLRVWTVSLLSIDGDNLDLGVASRSP
jgi:hypothetical protein